MCSLNSQISPTSKNRRLIHHESTKSLRPGQSLISSPHHGCCNNVFFLWENFLKVFGTGQSDVPSGTLMTMCNSENANMDSGSEQSILHDKTGIFLPSDSLLIAREWCLELSNWMSVYKMFAFIMQHVVIEVPECTSDCPEPN